MRSKIVAFVDNTHNSPLDKRYHELVLYKTILKINQKFLLDTIDKLERKIHIDELKGKIDISTISFKNELKVYEKNVAELIDTLESKIKFITNCEEDPVLNVVLEYTGLDTVVVALTAGKPSFCVNINVSSTDDLVERFKSIEAEGQRMSQRILSKRIGELLLAIENKELLQDEVDERIHGLKAREATINNLLKSITEAINNDKNVTDVVFKNQLIEQITNYYEPIIVEINNAIKLLKAYSASGVASSNKTIGSLKNSVSLELEIIKSRIQLNYELRNYGTNLAYFDKQLLALNNRLEMFKIFESILERNGKVTIEEKNKLHKLTGVNLSDELSKGISSHFIDFIKDAIAGNDIINTELKNIRSTDGIKSLNQLLQIISTLDAKSKETDIMLSQIKRVILRIRSQMDIELAKVEESNVSDDEKAITIKSIQERYKPILEMLGQAKMDLEKLAQSNSALKDKSISKYNVVIQHIIASKAVNVSNFQRIYSLVITPTRDLINSNSENKTQSAALNNEIGMLKANLAILLKILNEKMQKMQNNAVELREAA